MAPDLLRTRDLGSEDETDALAQRIAGNLRPGDVLLLEGPIGTGKTRFARALIQARLAACGRFEDVPSPTFTLVQTYDADDVQIWHADLYRLSGPGEIMELGLSDAFETAICLVEWPDRLGPDTPPDAMVLEFAYGDADDVRTLTVRSGVARWDALTQTEDADCGIGRFLAGTAWADSRRTPLAGDASRRRYERLSSPTSCPAVLMIAPPGSGEDTLPFLRIAKHLTAQGFSAPGILASDPENGFLLLEDLGDTLFATLAHADPSIEETLYEAAVDLLVALHETDLPDGLVPFDAPMLAQATELAQIWYAGAGEPNVDASLTAAFAETAARAPDLTEVLVLRDFHAENLIWLPERSGVARVGLLDFQDALLGHRAYDLMSLLQDARRDVPPDLADRMIARYVAATACDGDAFRTAYAILGAQRNLRILGIFARLSLEDGKTRYLNFVPRVWGHLIAALSHPDLSSLRTQVLRVMPKPDSDQMTRLRPT